MTIGWDYDAWTASWGRNAVVWANLDYRLPPPPEEFSWLVWRCLVAGRRAVRLLLVHPDTGVTAGVCCPPDNLTVNRAADGLLSAVTSADRVTVSLQKPFTTGTRAP